MDEDNKDYNLELVIYGAINQWLHSQSEQGEGVDYVVGDAVAELRGTFAVDELLEHVRQAVQEYYENKPLVP